MPCFKDITSSVKKLDNDALNLYTLAVIELMSETRDAWAHPVPRQLGQAREEFLL